MTRRKGLFFFLAWLGMVLYFTQRWILGPVIPALMREFQVDKTLLGVVGSASLWGYMFTPILAGVLSDRFGRKFAIMLGVVGFSALTVVCGLLNSPTQLIVARFFTGALEAFFFVPLIAYTLELFPERPGFYLTLMSSGSSLGWFTGPALSGWLLTMTGSWRAPFVTTGLCGLVLACLLLSAWPAREKRRPAGALFDRGVLRGRNLMLLVVLSVVFALDLAAEFGFTMWYPAYLELERHLTTAAAGALAGLYGVGQFCGRPVMGWVSDRLAYRPVGIAGAMIMGISMGLILILQKGSLLGVLTFQAGFIGAAVMGSVWTFTGLSFQSTKGLALGLITTAGYVLGSLGPLAIGYLADRGTLAEALLRVSVPAAFLAGLALLSTFLVRPGLIRQGNTMR